MWSPNSMTREGDVSRRPGSVLLAETVKDGIVGMAPANSAMVMSTGIVAIAMHNTGLHLPANAITVLCFLLWTGNSALLLARIAMAPRMVWKDCTNHGRSPGFLTLVAGTNVLGSCCVLVLDNTFAAELLFGIGLVVWPGLLTLIIFALIAGANKMPLETGINGAWLLMTVSTQSIVVLGSLLADPAQHPAGVLGMVMLFLLGCALYFMVMPVILYRLFFKQLTPTALNATFWIIAGAMAITCLAGNKLAPLLAASPELVELLPMVKAFSAVAWALATLWLPCLLLLGVWRHVIKKHRFAYGVEYWSMVFPLGMYTVCTQAIHGWYPFFPLKIPVYIGLTAAVTAWCLVFASFCLFLSGMMRQAFARENGATRK